MGADEAYVVFSGATGGVVIAGGPMTVGAGSGGRGGGGSGGGNGTVC